MAETNNSTGKYWVIALISWVCVFAFLFTKPEWFWIPLPFALTYLMLALDWL